MENLLNAGIIKIPRPKVMYSPSDFYPLSRTLRKNFDNGNYISNGHGALCNYSSDNIDSYGNESNGNHGNGNISTVTIINGKSGSSDSGESSSEGDVDWENYKYKNGSHHMADFIGSNLRRNLNAQFESKLNSILSAHSQREPPSMPQAEKTTDVNVCIFFLISLISV